MKNLLLLLTIIGIGLTSCNGKYTIAKRKYNKGFYVSRSNGNHTKPAVAISANSLKVNNNESIAKEVVTTQNKNFDENANAIVTITPPILSKPLINQNNEAFVITKKQSNTTITSSAANIKSPLQSIQPIKMNKNNLYASKKGGDDNLILWIILCFLWWLNLIAVYLHDGKDITLNFWITLILDFTFIGGVIFSLLVVLDVVDLR